MAGMLKNMNKTTKNNTGAASSKAKAKAQEIQAKKKADQRVMDEIWAIITIAIGAFLAVATMTGGAGEFGNMIGAALRGVFGFMAYILPFYLILFGVLLFARKTSHFSLRTFLLLLLILLMLATMNSMRFIDAQKPELSLQTIRSVQLILMLALLQFQMKDLTDLQHSIIQQRLHLLLLNLLILPVLLKVHQKVKDLVISSLQISGKLMRLSML